MRRRPLLTVLVVVGVLIGFFVAVVIGSSPGGNPATGVELAIQVLVLTGALLLLVGRRARG